MTAQTPEETPSPTYTRWAALPPFTIDGEGSARLWADLFPEEREFWRSLDAAQGPTQAQLREELEATFRRTFALHPGDFSAKYERARDAVMAAADAYALAAREPQAQLAARLKEVLLDVAVTPLGARIQALRLLDERPTTAMQQPQPAAEPGSLAARVAAEFAGYEADIASLTDQRNRVSDTADRLRAERDAAVADRAHLRAALSSLTDRTESSRVLTDDERAEYRKLIEAMKPLPAPGNAAELATLRALRAVVSHFAGTWDELMTSLPDDYGCEMNCAEANAAADLYRALGLDATAEAIIAAHAAHDDDEEREAHREDTP